MAEVLITLTIIGVIAVLTIPNLMKKHDRQIHEVKAKDAYNYVTNSIQLKLKESNCPDITCILAENDITPSTAMTKEEILKVLKVFFKDVEIDTRSVYAQYSPVYTLPGRRTSLDNFYPYGLFYYRINKRYGIAWGKGDFTKNNCSSNTQCFNLFLFTDGHKPQTKAVWNKNIFRLQIRGNGYPRICYRESTYYGKQHQYDPSGGYGGDGFCYLIRNSWQMDYLN